MRTSEVLKAAKKLIDTPEKWFQGSSAIGPNDTLCMAAAVTRVSMHSFKDFMPAIEVLQNVVGGEQCGLGMWNDAPERTHGDIMLAFSSAIEYEEAREAAADEAARGVAPPLSVPSGQVQSVVSEEPAHDYDGDEPVEARG